MTSKSTVENFTKNAVQSFIQTVVFVDDKIYSAPPGEVGQVLEIPAKSPKARKPAVTSGNEQKITSASGDITESLVSDKIFSPHDIQASFADRQIVCSLHQPNRNESTGIESTTYKLCACADIIILDWDLHGDAGVKTKKLILNLVEQSAAEDPHQLRLILVYTDNPDLDEIAKEIYAVVDSSTKLNNIISPAISESKAAGSTEGAASGEVSLSWRSSNTRVAILGKPSKRDAGFRRAEVKESDLADRAIEEFSKLADGLLQGSILMGLAAIRKQSKRILSKFHSGLDPAFLVHRALGLPHEEAFEHLTPLLVAELEAILEDSTPVPLISDEVIKNWCNEKWKPHDSAQAFLPEGEDIKTFAENFCILGMDIKDRYESGSATGMQKTIKSLKKGGWQRQVDDFNNLTSFLSKTVGGADHRELSQLMSQRTYYTAKRVLSLGVIIQKVPTETETETEYLLCLQPTCDCLRLDKPSTFIFSRLEISNNGKISYVVDDKDLIYKPKVENCVTVVFNPSVSGSGYVEADNEVFEDIEGGKFTWKAQLNTKHAQRASEEFARQLSRVGLTESEWLRLSSR